MANSKTIISGRDEKHVLVQEREQNTNKNLVAFLEQEQNENKKYLEHREREQNKNEINMRVLSSLMSILKV